MSTLPSLPATPKDCTQFMRELMAVSMDAATALVADKAASHQYVWLHAAAAAGFLPLGSQDEIADTGCRFGSGANPRFTAIAAMLKESTSLFQSLCGNGVTRQLQVDAFAMGEVIEVWVSGLEAYHENIHPTGFTNGAAIVLMSCALAAGREDLMDRLAALAKSPIGNSMVSADLLAEDGLIGARISPAALAISYSRPDMLEWLMRHGMQKRSSIVIFPQHSDQCNHVVDLITFTDEYAQNPEMLPHAIRLAKNADGTFLESTRKKLADCALKYISGDQEESPRFIAQLLAEGVLDFEDYREGYIHKSFYRGCLPVLEHLDEYVDGTAIADHQTKSTYLHHVINDDYLPADSRELMLDLLLAKNQSREACDADGYTPLECAVAQGNSIFVQKLLEAGAVPKFQSENMNEAGLKELSLVNSGSRDCIKAVMAWRARQTMTGVIDRATAPKGNP